MKITKTYLKKKMLKMWSTLVRNRDSFTCQWCHKTDKRNHAHHLVSRSIGSIPSWFDVDNGVTLCYRCHIMRIKSEVDEYIQFRDKWLKKKKKKYLDLRRKHSALVKWTIDDYLNRFAQLKRLIIKLENESQTVPMGYLPK